ncbi:ABC transporter substrate-binding protein [Planosporangium thailandense]|uniref:ABC transporter substrate-binding protein n=1 Tax=Planosporangium thailandense TaxID=765197 RepID=A0ABX0Y3R8_9ACTN|nr:ABC transporter substrate-binding protein [Planosporangium thailandense]NJC72050.1 ABC transporter substrate-binding protein [Planosporangium thailandense]
MRTSAWLVGLTTLVLVTGCSSAGQSGRAVTTGVADSVQLPADVRSGGTLTVGSDISYPPMESMENGKPVGFDVDLAGEIARRLGLRLTFIHVPFDSLLDEVQAHKIDAAMASMTDKAARQQQADFVDYLNAGSSIVIRKGAPTINGMAELCGHTVAVQTDTMYVDMVNEQAAKCPKSAPLRLVTADAPFDEVLAGRADVDMDDFPVAAAKVASTPELAISGEQIEAAPYGIAIAKDRRALTKAVQTTLYQLIRDGSYDKLLQKWKLPEGSLKTGAINGGA